MPDPRPVDDSAVGGHAADHAAIDRLASELLPALIAKLGATGLGELEVRQDGWRVRLRRPADGVARERRSSGGAARSQPGHSGHGHGPIPTEGSRQARVAHLVYASTSSVYGANETMPFSESQGVGHPMSLYAATKRANEVMAHSYSHLFELPTTRLRFFTVYGPWGRPDMALFRFAKAILAGEPIDVYNAGDMKRDFTYVDDIVEGVVRALDRIPAPDPDWSAKGSQPDPGRSGIAPFRIYNIGSGRPMQLMDYIHTLEACLERKAALRMLPMQPGDVAATYADTTALARDTGYTPGTSIEVGVARFVAWYREFYRV